MLFMTKSKIQAHYLRVDKCIYHQLHHLKGTGLHSWAENTLHTVEPTLADKSLHLVC